MTTCQEMQSVIDHLKYFDIFAETLGYLMNKKGAKQVTIANGAHVSPPTVSNWLSGGRMPADSGCIHLIGKALKLTPDEEHVLLRAFMIQRDAVDLVAYLEAVRCHGTPEECAHARKLVFELLHVGGNDRQLPDDYLPNMAGAPKR